MSLRAPALGVLLVALVLAPVAAGTGFAAALAADEPDAAPSLTMSNRATKPVVSDQNGTTGRLALPASERQTATVGNATLDVAGAVGAGADATTGRFAILRLETAFRNAETPEARQAVLGNARTRLAERIAALRDRERAALKAYNAGEITTEAYLSRLASIDAAASRLETAVDRLSQYASSVQNSPVTDRDIARLRARLLPLQGPVRDRARRALAGEGGSMRVYVSTSTTGVVTAAVTGPGNRQYVRSAYLASARAPDQPDQFKQHDEHPFTVARDRAQALYPWAFQNRLSLSIGDPVLYRAAVYPVVIDHPQGVSRTGDLVTYLDGGTTDAFLEHQYKSVERAPTETLGTNETEDVRLVVNRTHAGGPLSVRVATPNGTSLDAQVAVNGVDVGRTGLDGQLWAIAPDGEVTVTVTAEGEAVTVAGRLPSSGQG